MSRGLVVGKFWPPHAGHHHLVATAASRVDELVVVVGDSPGETIPWPLRMAWLREAHPGVRVERIEDRWPGDSIGWAAACLAAFGRFDVVFTSEGYGDGFAAALGCRHECVDLARTRFPVSGSAVRADPWACWAMLSPPVRAYYTCRVVIVGAESSGKTTLAARLAAHLGCAWVPEYGRTYCEDLLARGERVIDRAWASPEFEHIAARQAADEEAAARASGGWLVCDTDAFATAVWHEHYLGRPHPGLLAWRPPPSGARRLYLLASPDTPFVQDGLRDGEHRRAAMDARFSRLLEERGEAFVRISGGWKERWERVVGVVAAGKWGT
ncbi:MAG: AAA family ATPase [Myxococcota bacterium]